MQLSMFPEYKENEEVKPIMRVGSFALVKYEKKSKTLGDIFKEAGEWEFDKPKKKRGITSERQAILKEIQTLIEQENGAPMDKKQMRTYAIKLSHVPTEDLYWMKSQGLDYRNRGKGAFGKFIYGSIKVKVDK